MAKEKTSCDMKHRCIGTLKAKRTGTTVATCAIAAAASLARRSCRTAFGSDHCPCIYMKYKEIVNNILLVRRHINGKTTDIPLERRSTQRLL